MEGQSEIDRINHSERLGEYCLSDRGYLKCTFEGLTMTGLPLEKHPEILTFHCSTSSGDYAYGSAYARAL